MKTKNQIDYSISQTHPNRGYIIFLFNNAGSESVPFFVNNQIIPGVASSLERKYEAMGFEASSIDDLVELVSYCLYN